MSSGETDAGFQERRVSPLSMRSQPPCVGLPPPRAQHSRPQPWATGFTRVCLSPNLRCPVAHSRAGSAGAPPGPGSGHTRLPKGPSSFGPGQGFLPSPTQRLGTELSKLDPTIRGPPGPGGWTNLIFELRGDCPARQRPPSRPLKLPPSLWVARGRPISSRRRCHLRVWSVLRWPWSHILGQ